MNQPNLLKTVLKRLIPFTPGEFLFFVGYNLFLSYNISSLFLYATGEFNLLWSQF